VRRKAVTLVGIGDDGCVGLSSRAANAVAQAQVLVGGERHLAFFPQFKGERVVLKDQLGAALERVAELAHEHDVCVLASGDPLFFGVGALVIKKLGAEHVEVIPQPSSIQHAFARVGVKWDDAAFVSLHGRALDGFAVRARRLAKLAVFTDEESSPARIAQHLTDWNAAEPGEWRAWVCENLGGAGERVRAFTVEELRAAGDIAPLNVLILQRSNPDWRPQPAMSFLHEDAFAKRMPKKGLITKREARLLSLAQLHLRPSSVVWDVGAGSGSVAVEAALTAYEGRVYAVEVDAESVDICRDNARAHSADNVRVVAGRAPEALAELEAPDAVFVGGSKGAMDEIVELALERLRAGGRLVVNAITLENVGETYACLRRRGLEPDVLMLNVSRAEPLARYMRWEAQNPIHIFAVEKP
jgi:precorrin-6Y C5,15-methyltransferase (decarboxylating)